MGRSIRYILRYTKKSDISAFDKFSIRYSTPWSRPFLVSKVKVTSNHLITPKQALPITHLASASINPHVPSSHIQGGERGDAEVWARLAASQRPQDANIFKGEASRRLQGHVYCEVALFRGGGGGFKFAKLWKRRKKRQDTPATCQLTVIPWNKWIVHECH